LGEKSKQGGKGLDADIFVRFQDVDQRRKVNASNGKGRLQELIAVREQVTERIGKWVISGISRRSPEILGRKS